MGTPKHTSSTSLNAKLIQGFGVGEDGVHLHGGEVRQCFVKPKPNIPLDSAHFDGFQLIYPSKTNQQYALGFIESFSIIGSVVDGLTTPIQCVFASDGVFGHGEIRNNVLKTDGHHFISVNGLLSGVVTGNRFIGTHASDFPIKFKPARPGGNPDGQGNIWILSWKDDFYQYRPIECDTPELVLDLRQRVFNTTDKFLVNFDQPKFDRLAADVPKAGGRAMGREFQRIALLCGDIVTEFTPKELTMKMSDAGIKQLIEEEGFKRVVYKDVGADGFDTVGVGHKLTRREIGRGEVIIGGVPVAIYFTELTDEQIFQLLRQDVEEREVILTDLLEGITVTQRQFDALMIFMFNVGRTAFKRSTLLKRLKAGKFEEVPAQMRRWNIFQGEVLPALSARRERTIAFWNGTDRYENIASEVLDLPAKTEPVHYDNEPAKTKVYDEAYAAAHADLKRQFIQDKPMEPQVHEKKLDSTTLQGVLGMIVSAVFTYAVGKGWMPEAVSTLVQPIALEILGGVAGAFFSKRAWDGRLNAVKTFK